MSNSCFKIMACGNRESIEDDDLESSPQNKGTNDKRGWSFRKKSARHRVLNNTVISETPPIKDSPEPTHTQPEKNSAIQWTEEKTHFPTMVDSKSSEILATEPNLTTPDESVVILIQASIRGFLARKVLLKHKNVIKLQAAVRGHLVRKQAVGSLRCVQAIVKMQALVRARNANSVNKSLSTYTSLEKLLSNKFASQLLESTSRSGSINIKCDPAKSDSSWKWLQRWMSDSLKENNTVQEDEKKIEHVEFPLDTVEQVEKMVDHSGEISLDTKEPEEELIDGEILFNTEKTKEELIEQDGEILLDTKKSEQEKELVNYGGEFLLDTKETKEGLIEEDGEISLDTKQSEQEKELVDYGDEISLDKEKLDEKNIEYPLDCVQMGEEKIELVESEEETVELKAKIESSENFDVEEFKSVNLSLEQLESENINDIYSNEIISDVIPTQEIKSDPEINETEEKKFSFESRKVTNPAFLAAQSKFEELSSANPIKLTSLTKQDKEAESYTETDDSFKNKESEQAENVVNFVNDTDTSKKLQNNGSDISKFQFSECETELSISSTLDSPDRSVKSNEIEVKGLITVSSRYFESNENFEVDETKREFGIDSVTSLDLPHVEDKSNIKVDLPVQIEEQNNDLAMSEDLPEVEKNSKTDEFEANLEKGDEILKSEQGTPSSEVSVKHKRTRGDNKRKSPGKIGHELKVRSSIEKLPKDHHKSVKRRNSFGSPKLENVDQEPRDSSSSSNNPLPSYMQPTKSAKLKALPNTSPISSPDVQDKEVLLKKRHSLPTGNGRYGSPQIQRVIPPAEVQLSGKGNGIQSPQEKKWRR